MTAKHRSYFRWGLAVLAALLPVAAIGLYSLLSAEASLRRIAREQNDGVAAIASESLRHHLQRSVFMGQLVAGFPVFGEAVKAHDVPEVRERLRRFLAAVPDVDRAFVLDPSGLEWCDWPVAPESLGHNFSQRDYYKGVRRRWQAYISEAFQRQAEPRLLVIAIAVPVRDSAGEVVGILVFQHRLETITGWVRRIGRAPGTEVVVLDASGTVAGHSRVPVGPATIEDYASLPGVQAALQGTPQTVEYNDPLSGRPMVAALEPVPMGDSPPWIVIGQQDREAAMAPARDLRKHIRVAICVVALLAAAAAVGLARVSERNRAMSIELADRNAKLQEAVVAEHRAFEALKKAQEQLVQSEKMASLGQMVAGIAHEINNPLSFVSNNAAVLQRDLVSLRELLSLYMQGDAQLRAQRPELMRQIEQLGARIDLAYTLSNLDGLLDRSRDGLRRIQQIVKDLRDFARLDESMVDEADINAGIESTVNIVRGRARKKEVTIELALGELPRITCALARINQVIMNLLANAIDACPVGGRVLVRSGLENEQVCVWVTDNGPGVPEDIRLRIFDPFFTTKPLGEGVGLGLSISYGIVRDHHGTLSVDSPPGQGATFTLRLPVARQNPPT